MFKNIFCELVLDGEGFDIFRLYYNNLKVKFDLSMML